MNTVPCASFAPAHPEARANSEGTSVARQLQVFAAPMMEMNRKDIYAISSYQMRSRMADGQAMKDPNREGR